MLGIVRRFGALQNRYPSKTHGPSGAMRSFTTWHRPSGSVPVFTTCTRTKKADEAGAWLE